MEIEAGKHEIILLHVCTSLWKSKVKELNNFLNIHRMLTAVSGVVPDYYISVPSIIFLFISPCFLVFLSFIKAGDLDIHCLPQKHCSKNSTFSPVTVHMREIYLPNVMVARYHSTWKCIEDIAWRMSYGLLGLSRLGVGTPQIERWRL